MQPRAIRGSAGVTWLHWRASSTPCATLARLGASGVAGLLARTDGQPSTWERRSRCTARLRLLHLGEILLRFAPPALGFFGRDGLRDVGDQRVSVVTFERGRGFDRSCHGRAQVTTRGHTVKQCRAVPSSARSCRNPLASPDANDYKRINEYRRSHRIAGRLVRVVDLRARWR